MRYVYKLIHRRVIDTTAEIFETKLLGFFSSQEKCEEAISFYLKLPGFKNYPQGFTTEKIEADLDDFNCVSGKFSEYVYYLSHEWYDGTYDYVSNLGYYSTYENAKAAEKKYRLSPELLQHQNGFEIDTYTINQLEWKEGFFSWRKDGVREGGIATGGIES